MKNFFDWLKGYFTALFSTSGTIVSILMGLAAMFLLGFIGVQGQNDDGSMGWGGYVVVVFMVLFWIVGIYHVIQNFRGKVADMNQRSISVGDVLDKLKGSFASAIKPVFEKYPNLYIFTLGLALCVFFFVVGNGWAAVCFAAISYLVLINDLK